MAKLPRYPTDYQPTGDDLNHILAIIDSGLNNVDPIIAGITGTNLSPTIPNPGGSFNPGTGNIGSLTIPQGLSGSYGIDNFSQTHTAYVLLSWTPNPITDFVARYDIYYHQGSNPTLYTQSVGGNITSTRINNLFPGNTYSFAVKATDAADRSSAWCPELNITISFDSDAPAVPTGLTAIGTTNGVALFWNEVGADGISNDLKQYQIQIALDSTFTTFLPSDEHSTIVVSSGISNPNPWLVTVGPGNSFFYPYWINGATLYFRIRTLDWTGNVSDWSSSTNAVIGFTSSSLVSFTGNSIGGSAVRSDGTVGNFNTLDFTNPQQPGPVARIGAKYTGGGSELHFGVSNNYASGITLDALQIGPTGNVSFAGTLSSVSGALGVSGGLNVTGNTAFTGNATVSGGLQIQGAGNVGAGVIGFAALTGASQTGISSITDVNECSITFSATAGRRYRVTGNSRLASSITGDNMRLNITDGSNAILASDSLDEGGVNNNKTLTPILFFLPSTTGSYTLKLRADRVSGTGTITVPGGAQYNVSGGYNVTGTWILIEDIGT